jgi:hypothetical protein
LSRILWVHCSLFSGCFFGTCHVVYCCRCCWRLHGQSWHGCTHIWRSGLQSSCLMQSCKHAGMPCAAGTLQKAVACPAGSKLCLQLVLQHAACCNTGAAV